MNEKGHGRATIEPKPIATAHIAPQEPISYGLEFCIWLQNEGFDLILEESEKAE